ncbi:acyl-CoA dehydrogenase family protein [Nocardioides zeae]|uniref:Acyl-CoA dehydrogenase n=1 Tax=Nocardioides zeae TaxID=1457234 RepID=A0A6P0HM34_9ACTN|nr:acyl-CoA dehydrogenase family protein [Nocardioides zeae]NEN79742.1 acyl-CoA dehydrogenase [Nocardioides zeae]
METLQKPSVEEFTRFFLEDYEPASGPIEETDVIPPDLLKRAADAGAYRLTTPTEFGGWNLTIGDYLPYLEGAARGHGSGRMLVHLTNGVWRPLARFGNESQRALVAGMASGDVVVAFCLTEQSGGTGRDLKSVARRDGDGWRLTGEKHLITFADRADHFIIVVATDDERGKDSLTAFLVPRHTDGFEIDATQRTMGLHGTGHAWLRYNDIYVADADRLGEVGQGLEVALSFLDYSRVSLSNCMVGLAQRALDEAAAFAKERTTFGQPIATRQAIQTHLADMYADVSAGRGLVRHAAALADAGENYTAAASTAKLFCLNMVGRVTDLSLRVHGGYGYTTDAAIERIYRDARGFWFEEGTAEIQQLVVARHVLDS